MDEEFLASVTGTAWRWSGVPVPNETGRQLAADLQTIISDFEAVRDHARFEDEPADFEAALIACREPE